ncbi:DUF1699 family protein [Methanolobus halotolerans]|uniref:DUF1699 family protein n=1 Tax=Methanolobus halotolerans TaxID=2052935 RepID=A0A4E0Q632_9EURY|nr:DUF1699 family protein [Methanolobus halotolerans]TGC09456.1 hypothetical protein CUN85_06400 [Methanolobus halotolerans]
MKIRVVSSKQEIDTLGQNEQIIHIAFRPSNTDIFSLVSKCPKVKALQVPPSYKKTISKSTKMFLNMQGIALVEGDVWGHRRDINEYSEISPAVYELIEQYRGEGLSDEEIEARMVQQVNMGPDLIRFILKNRK